MDRSFLHRLAPSSLFFGAPSILEAPEQLLHSTQTRQIRRMRAPIEGDVNGFVRLWLGTHKVWSWIVIVGKGFRPVWKGIVIVAKVCWMVLKWVHERGISFWTASCATSLTILVLTSQGADKRGAHSTFSRIAIFPAWITFGHFIFTTVCVGCCCGRGWNHERLQYCCTQQWFWKSAIQLTGFAFGIVVNELIVRAELPPILMLLYCLYAVCSTQFAKLPSKLEVTSTWLSSTAIVAFDTSRASPSFWYPYGLIIGLVVMVFFKNFFDRPARVVDANAAGDDVGV